MKIAFIRNKYDPYGGGEKFTQTLVESLAERGVEVHIFACQWIESENKKIHFHHIRDLKKPPLFQHVSFVFFARRAIRSKRFDLVQSNERTLYQDIYRAGDGVHAQWLELRGLHQNYLRRLLVQINPFHHYLRWLERRLLEDSNLKAVIVNSNMVRNDITARFQTPNDRIHTIYNGVDLDRFSPMNKLTIGNRLRSECGIVKEVPIVLFVGSGFERKGLAYLIRGMAIAGGNAHLWVVGKGNPRPYRKLAQKLNLNSKITFWGPHEDVIHFYAAADIFAFPTIYDPFSTAVLEALATGLPVITTAQCGTAEIISHGKEGFILSSPSATKELGSYLNDLYNPKQRHTFSFNARKKAEAFPVERTIDELQRLYLRLAERNTIQKET